MFPVCYYLVASFSVSRDLEIYLMVKLIVALWLCLNQFRMYISVPISEDNCRISGVARATRFQRLRNATKLNVIKLLPTEKHLTLQ